MMTAERLWQVFHGLKEPLVMVIVQIAMAGYSILYKLAVNQGMSAKIFVVYRFIFALAFLAPLAFFYERSIRPRFTWKVLIQSFFCGLFGGSLGQTLYLESLSLTSATYASAMLNLVPAVTFVLAVLFRMEKLSIRRLEGIAKVIGTLLGLGGAMLLTFYKGIELNIYPNHGHHPSDAGSPPVQQNQNIVLGSILAVCSCLSISTWFIIQAKMNKEYPCPLSSTALMAFMGMIQALIYAFAREHDWNKWRLHWNMGLLSVVYTGVVSSGLCVTLMTWCIRMRGPLFVSMFNPLMLVVLALMAPLLLDEKLYLGSVIGAAVIICGLYAVLWGQGRERKRLNQLAADNASPAVEISAATQTKDDPNDKRSGSTASRGEAEQKYSELEEGRKSSVKRSQESGRIVPLMHNT